MLLEDEHVFERGVCSRMYVCMRTGQRVDALARLVALRHYDARIDGSIAGLGSCNTATLNSTRSSLTREKGAAGLGPGKHA